ncbi:MULTISPECIES: hypothetical protein [Okeania]|uniref:Uncharacterized protein n=1 Tax=Okeania hirsuta TaxID=1458930 RepID=A0A3N6PUL6_9CYAN|nr:MULTISPECIES: hypothetical protein [Okeania]NEP07950.1 hypothetical protein [Okeania sp. SIO4D6]NEP39384.1 hypothetical protein [Okeania sp. SIO2H7]NET13213.1 hypothetical protein [Okeania sp. SIO1H6]NEP72603.1 hypothetical protein [Okeania sp. SIO2G5]NEP94359.1 hypothetical protein [Okeania sp. SIO2F5]
MTVCISFIEQWGQDFAFVAGFIWVKFVKRCNQLQFHPDLVKPENKDAAEACLKYAGWDDQTKAEFRDR